MSMTQKKIQEWILRALEEKNLKKNSDLKQWTSTTGLWITM